MSMSDNAKTLAEFMRQVWNAGDSSAVDRFLADSYTIHSDPGDPWDGQTLSRKQFVERLVTSRGPFPDLHFDWTDIVAEDDRVVIAWTMRGTQTGPMGGRAASMRSFETKGITIYYFDGGRITGHRQVVDRLTVARQLGLTG